LYIQTTNKNNEAVIKNKPFEQPNDSFFIRYENEINLTRVIEQNESKLSPQNNDFDVLKKIIEEEEKMGKN